MSKRGERQEQGLGSALIYLKEERDAFCVGKREEADTDKAPGRADLPVIKKKKGRGKRGYGGKHYKGSTF